MSDDEIREIAQACHKSRAFIDPDKVLLLIWTLGEARNLLRLEKIRTRRQREAVMKAMQSKNIWKRAKGAYATLRDVASGKV